MAACVVSGVNCNYLYLFVRTNCATVAVTQSVVVSTLLWTSPLKRLVLWAKMASNKKMEENRPPLKFTRRPFRAFYSKQSIDISIILSPDQHF